MQIMFSMHKVLDSKRLQMGYCKDSLKSLKDVLVFSKRSWGTNSEALKVFLSGLGVLIQR